MAVRQKIVAARYSNIADEDPTFNFIIQGLKKQTTLTLILRHILFNNPARSAISLEYSSHFSTLTSQQAPLHFQSQAHHALPGTTDHSEQAFTHAPNTDDHCISLLPTPTKAIMLLSPLSRSPLQSHRRPMQGPQQPQPTQQPTTSPLHTHWTVQLPHPIQYAPLKAPQLSHQKPPVDVISQADTDKTGTFILDSVTHSTHITKRYPHIQTLQPRILTQSSTENQTRAHTVEP